MIDRLFGNQTMSVLSNALRATDLEHQVIAHNLANVDTPGFKRSEVLFQSTLAAALRAQTDGSDQLQGTRTNPNHLPIGEVASPSDVQGQAVVRAETSLRPDGNNVDIDAEMTRLSENTVLYQALSQLVKMKLTQLRSAIREGR
jgi:flagellar basal-body rod protein FlgB